MSFVGKWSGGGRDDRYDRGIRAYDRGQYEEAIELFDSCIRFSRDPATARLARFYKAESLTQMGGAALRSADVARAAELLAQAVELHPTYPDLRFLMSLALRAMRRRTEERAALAEALKLNPRYARAMVLDGLHLYEDGSRESGWHRVREGVEYEPNLNNERFRAAWAAHAEGNYDRCAAYLEALALADISDANAQMRLGDRFAHQELWEEAERAYQQALVLAPDYVDIRLKYARCWFELENPKRAVAEAEAALRINPKYHDAWAFLIEARRAAGDLRGAQDARETLAKLIPNVTTGTAPDETPSANDRSPRNGATRAVIHHDPHPSPKTPSP